jgi:hypothetical protein
MHVAAKTRMAVAPRLKYLLIRNKSDASRDSNTALYRAQVSHRTNDICVVLFYLHCDILTRFPFRESVIPAHVLIFYLGVIL